MAVCTCTRNNPSVAHRRTTKSSSALMAGLTGCGSLDMAAWLAFSGRTVVAISATGGDASVTH